MRIHQINIRCYADVVLIEESDDDFQRILQAFNKQPQNFQKQDQKHGYSKGISEPQTVDRKYHY